MNANDGPDDGPQSAGPSTRKERAGDKHSPRLAGVLMVVVLLVLASGVIALECGLYKALDDNWLKMEASAASSALALFGASSAEREASAPNPAAGAVR